MTILVLKGLFYLTILASLAAAVPHQRHGAVPGSGNCSSQQQQNAPDVGRAIYFLTNDAENSVVALPISNDGTVSHGIMTKTGGAGSIAINGATMQPGTPDALVGQSSLTVSGNRISTNDTKNLFAVNAGSNTLTMMSISTSDPTRLIMIGKPVTIPGEFPNTVAASAMNNLACVGTTGAAAGISCARFSASSGLEQMDALRVFDINQSTPPVGPTNTVSHTFFSNDESMLFTTVKGDPTVNNTGFLSMFPVQQAPNGDTKLSTEETRSSANGTAVLFGSATIPNSTNLFVTDASFGAAILSVDETGQVSSVSQQPIAGQKATCWATISGATNSAFVTDVGTNRIVEMSVVNASIIQTLDLSADGDPGQIDLKSAGSFVYALSPGNGTTSAAITVLDVSGGQGSMKKLQRLDLAGAAGKTAQGMAVMV
ncbi:hypothetical protein EJ07DRAFT_142597 [Lizonia empirigonia]|nr:hypothetical protein EJ07DRAFT_142597 [Lizonia empirigonia]